MSAPIALVELLRLDGVVIPDGEQTKRLIPCINPFHTSLVATMTIDIGNGTYDCTCGAHGTALTYLTRIRKIDDEAACLKLKSLGWTDERINHARNMEQDDAAHREGLPKHFADIPKVLVKKKLLRLHKYKRIDGQDLVTMALYDSGNDIIKKFPFTPARRGGWWMCEPTKSSLPPEDRHADKFPLYRLNDLKNEMADARRQVWIVHDELTADLVAALPADPGDKVKGPANGPPPVTCLFSNKRQLKRIDLNLLYGRMVLLLAKTDEESRAYMRLVGSHLNDKGCAVKYFLPPGDGGYSLCEALSQEGWAGALSWIQGIGTILHDSENPLFAGPSKSQRDLPPVPAPPMDRTPHFRVLGIHDGHIVFQISKTGEIYYCRDTQVGNIGVLQKLAPLAFWVEQSDQEGLSVKNRMKFADALLRAAQARGLHDPMTDSHGRGAGYFPDRRAYYHLGDRLLLENEETHLLDVPASFNSVEEDVFMPRKRITVVDSSEEGRQYLRAAYAALIRYHFMNLHHARAFMGFMVTSIIGGLLDLRPMLWLIAMEATGKTFLLNDFSKPFLGEMLTASGDTTEAGLVDQMRNDSLPVYVDEFEPGEGRYAQERFRSVLKSIRLASSGESRRIRAGGIAGGMVPNVIPRYSMMVSSINRPRLSNADFGRFFMCRLSVARATTLEWPAIKKDIIESVAGDKAKIIRSTIIRNAERIAHSVREIEASLSERFSKQRDLQIIASLTAGAGFASGNYETITRETTDSSNTTLTPFDLLLGSMVPARGGSVRMSLMECLSLSTWGRWSESMERFEKFTVDLQLADVAARYGLKISYDRFAEHGLELYVALGMKSMTDQLRGTDAENIDLDNYLQMMPGIEVPKSETGERRRVRFSGAKRYVMRVSNPLLHEIGFFPDNAAEDPRKETVYTEDKKDDDRLWS